MSQFEEEILATNTKFLGTSSTKSLRGDAGIVVEVADKGSGVVVWERKDYLKKLKTTRRKTYSVSLRK